VRRALVLLTQCLWLGCAHTTAVGQRGIYLDCDVPMANVYVDDFYLDHALKWTKRPMPLTPGHHRIEIDAPGYYPFYGEFNVGERGFQPVSARLRRSFD
jgi:hypothetical protein